jgi:hypothetical protein
MLGVLITDLLLVNRFKYWLSINRRCPLLDQKCTEDITSHCFQQNRVRTDDYYARFSINGPATDPLAAISLKCE